MTETTYPNYDITKKHLLEQPVGTVAIIDTFVFFKTTGYRDKNGQPNPRGDRWFCPRHKLYYSGVEFSGAVCAYPEGRLVLI